MGDNQQWITVDEVVASYLDRIEQDGNKYFKIWQIAFDGMKQLGLDFYYTIKSLKLPINANLTVNLPADFLQYTKIGVLNDSGDVIPLTYNSKLTSYADLFDARLQRTQDFTLGTLANVGNFIFYNFWDGYGFFETLYGLPSGGPFIGSFKIDYENRVILLNETFFYSYVILEYVSSPNPKQGTYYVPMQFKEALLAFIAWKDVQFLPNTRKTGLADKLALRKDFYNERRLAIARYKPINLEELYEANLRNVRLAVKI